MQTFVWIYFVLFAIVILVVLWLGQYVFLYNYYKSAKVSSISREANRIIQAYGTEEQGHINRTVALLEEKLHIKNYKVYRDEELHIFEQLDDIALVSKTITDAGFTILKFVCEGASLEEYYLSKVGGNNV